MLLQFHVMLAIGMKQHIGNIFNRYPVLKVEVTLFLQRGQKELIGSSKEAKRIGFFGISFRKRFGFALFFFVWEWKIDASNVNEIENIVQRDEIDVILSLIQINLGRRN